jgi:hypothetical protein
MTHYEWSRLGYTAPSYQTFVDGHGKLVMLLTEADQEKFVGDDWKEYEKEADWLDQPLTAEEKVKLELALKGPTEPW